mgnify:FL=1
MATTVVFTVKGMKCVHCQASVESAVKAVAGVTAVSVDLAAGTATVSGDFDPAAVTAAVAAAGFRATAQ